MTESKAKTWPERVAEMSDAELSEQIRKGNREELVQREVMVRLLRDRLQVQKAARAANEAAIAAKLAAKRALSAADAAAGATACIRRLLKPPPRSGFWTRARRACWPTDLEITEGPDGHEIHATEGGDR